MRLRSESLTSLMTCVITQPEVVEFNRPHANKLLHKLTVQNVLGRVFWSEAERRVQEASAYLMLSSN